MVVAGVKGALLACANGLSMAGFNVIQGSGYDSISAHQSRYDL